MSSGYIDVWSRFSQSGLQIRLIIGEDKAKRNDGTSADEHYKTLPFMHRYQINIGKSSRHHPVASTGDEQHLLAGQRLE